MNKLYVFLVSLTLATLLICCNKDTNILDPTPQPTGQPAVTAVGNPVGTAVTATIGPAGGRIESDDKRIRIDIPAGALANSQPISVQALDQNHCPGGAGAAFRLLPHGLTFAKPATITFSYEQEDVTDSDPELLRVAYQRDDQGWYSPATVRLDTTSRQVITETTHFSDWTLLKSAQLEPPVHAIDPGASIVITVRSHINSTASADLDIPVSMGIDNENIKEWTLQGQGHLDEHGTTVATYMAPAHIPDNNPQVVTVLIGKTINNVQRQIRLKAKIYVLGEGLVFRINRGPWIPTTSPLGLSRVSRGKSNFLTVSTGLSAPGLFANVSLSWPEFNANVNSYTVPWQLKTNENEMNIPIIYLTTNPKGTPLYAFFYEANKAAYPSPGNFQVSRKAYDNDGYYIGSFTLKKAGILEYSGGTDPVFDGIAEVEGYFRFKLARQL